MANHLYVLWLVGLFVVGCHASSGGSSSGPKQQGPGDEPTPASSDARNSTNENRYPIQILGIHRAPPGTLEFLDGMMSKVVANAKGLKPDPSAEDDPNNREWWFFQHSIPWIAKVQVVEGPIVVEEGLGPYPGGSPYDVGLFLKWRYYTIKIVETWLGKPSREDYQLWDIGGYCPGDLAYCPDGDLIFDPKKCLRIDGKYFAESVSCEYRDPKTGILLVSIGDLDWPSGLEAGAAFILFGADFLVDHEPGYGWGTVKRVGGDLSLSTITAHERFLFRTQGNQLDVGFLFYEDFPGSRGPGFPKYPDSRWIPKWMLAQRILERIVMPYLQKHPDDRPFVESALSGPLLQEYLSPTQVPQSAEAD